jgi:hypothetical protein
LTSRAELMRLAMSASFWNWNALRRAPLFGPLPVRDVGDRAVEARQAPAGPLPREGRAALPEHPQDRAVRADHPIFRRIRQGVIGLHRRLDGRPHPLSVLGMDEGEGLFEADRPGGPAEDLPESLVGLQLSRRRVDVPGAELGGIEGQAPALVEPPVLRRGPMPLRDIDDDPGKAPGIARGVVLRLAPGDDPPRGAVGLGEAVFRLVLGPRPDRPPDDLGDPLAVLGVDGLQVARDRPSGRVRRGDREEAGEVPVRDDPVVGNVPRPGGDGPDLQGRVEPRPGLPEVPVGHLDGLQVLEGLHRGGGEAGEARQEAGIFEIEPLRIRVGHGPDGADGDLPPVERDEEDLDDRGGQFLDARVEADRLGHEEGGVPVEHRAARAEFAGHGPAKIRGIGPGRRMPAEDPPAPLGLFDADARRAGPAEFEGRVDEFLEDGLRGGGHRLREGDQGPALRLEVGRAARAAGQLLVDDDLIDGGEEVFHQASAPSKGRLAWASRRFKGGGAVVARGLRPSTLDCTIGPRFPRGWKSRVIHPRIGRP